MVVGIISSFLCFVFLVLDHYFRIISGSTLGLSLVFKILASSCFLCLGLYSFFKCKDKKWDGGIQILWAKSVKWRQIRARWRDFGGQTRDLWAKPSGGFEKSVHLHANFKPLPFLQMR